MSLPVAAFFARRADAGGLSLHHQPVLSERIVIEDLTLDDPHLDPAHAVSGVRGGLRIIDIAAQRVQRHPALAIPFGTRDFGAAETARAGDTNAFGTQAKRRLNRTLHGAAERDAALELVS